MTANKALVAAVLAAAASIIADVRGTDSTLTFQDWVVVVLAAVVAGGVTYVVPNRPAPVHRGQAGYGTVELIIGVLVVLVLLVLLVRLIG